MREESGGRRVPKESSNSRVGALDLGNCADFAGALVRSKAVSISRPASPHNFIADGIQFQCSSSSSSLLLSNLESSDTQSL